MKYFLPALLLAVPACLDTEPDPTTTVGESAIIGGTPTGCPIWGCNENSPLMGPFGNFHELHPEGIPNLQGMIVTGFRFEEPGKLYKPRIVDGSRIVVDYPAENVTLSGADLTGGWFMVQSAATGDVYKLIIDSVRPRESSVVRFWLGAHDRIETYVFSWRAPTEQPNDPKAHHLLCNNAPGRESGEGGDHTWPDASAAFVFTGDRYDAQYKRVTSIDDTSGFFNIACAGSAIAKLHLNRHTSLSSPGPNGQTTTKPQRQAMLKMYVSDLCGTGTAWTQKGTPLFWQNYYNWNTITGPIAAHEARWTSAGAVCLDTHRLGTLYQNPTYIYGECLIPSCASPWPSRELAYLNSWVPAQP